MSSTSRINKSPFSNREKSILRKALADKSRIVILETAYTHTQSNVTLADITNFRIPVEAYKTYKFTISLVCTANVSGGAKFGITAPTASFCVGQVQADGASTSATTVATVAAGATAAAVELLAVGTYKGTADGYVQVQAAQNASHASDTVVLAGSFIQLEEV